MATTFDRARHTLGPEAGERLRVEKLHTGKGAGIFTALIAFSFVWMAIAFWTASQISP